MKSFTELRGYFRGSMQRRLFVLFGVSILLTSLTFTGVSRLFDGAVGAPWRREMGRLRAFVGDRFAHVWDDAAARNELADAMAEHMRVKVTLRDADGTILRSDGACDFSFPAIPVRHGDDELGTVTACTDRARWGSLWRFILPMIVAGLLLWALSGVFARRLASPLRDLARVAEQIGAGNLAVRSPLEPGRHGEVGALAHVINDMAAKIEKAMADQRQLLAVVSHELRTPLGRIRILTDLGRSQLGEHKNWEEIDREVAELDGLVGDLLASSRLEFTALTILPHDAVHLAARALERAGVSAELLFASSPEIALRGDATLLSRALANLISNAVGHGGGITALRVTARDGRVAFEAEDKGPGFKLGDGDRVFEAFFHGTQEGHGTLGLGLALVRRIAAAHGGTSYARNRDGGGALVGFEIAMAGPPAVPQT